MSCSHAGCTNCRELEAQVQWNETLWALRASEILTLVTRAYHLEHFDLTGPLADQALFFAGSVKMYENDWRDADGYFTQIYEQHPNSPLAPKAIELAIMAKNLSTGGSEYDGRKAGGQDEPGRAKEGA